MKTQYLLYIMACSLIVMPLINALLEQEAPHSLQIIKQTKTDEGLTQKTGVCLFESCKAGLVTVNKGTQMTFWEKRPGSAEFYEVSKGMVKKVEGNAHVRGNYDLFIKEGRSAKVEGPLEFINGEPHTSGRNKDSLDNRVTIDKISVRPYKGREEEIPLCFDDASCQGKNHYIAFYPDILGASSPDAKHLVRLVPEPGNVFFPGVRAARPFEDVAPLLIDVMGGSVIATMPGVDQTWKVEFSGKTLMVNEGRIIQSSGNLPTAISYYYTSSAGEHGAHPMEIKQSSYVQMMLPSATTIARDSQEPQESYRVSFYLE